MKDQICFAEKRFFEWHKDTVSVTLRQKSGSYGGGSEVLVVEETDGAEGHLFVAVYDARGNG